MQLQIEIHGAELPLPIESCQLIKLFLTHIYRYNHNAFKDLGLLAFSGLMGSEMCIADVIYFYNV